MARFKGHFHALHVHVCTYESLSLIKSDFLVACQVCGGGHWCLYAKCIGASKLIRGGLRSLNRGTTVPENGPNPWPTFSVVCTCKMSGICG